MAAGTDITHPVSALEAAYKPIPLEPLPVCTIKENGVAVDNNDPSIVEKNRKDRETLQASSRPPRPNPNAAPPTASFVRRSVSTARLTSLSSASDLDTVRFNHRNSKCAVLSLGSFFVPPTTIVPSPSCLPHLPDCNRKVDVSNTRPFWFFIFKKKIPGQTPYHSICASQGHYITCL